MATYRIKVNQRTKAGKDLLNYLRGFAFTELMMFSLTF